MSVYYFAYGSNMNPEQMRERCPDADPVCRAMLEEHALAFGGHSPHWEGSPATIVVDEARRVPGLIYELPHREIQVLDHFEGHPVRYERREKFAVDEEGRERPVQVYVKDLDDNFGSPPEAYLTVLRRAYRELGFDSSALEQALHLGRDDSDDAQDSAEDSSP